MGVEAIGVCLALVHHNPVHELKIGEMIERLICRASRSSCSINSTLTTRVQARPSTLSDAVEAIDTNYLGHVRRAFCGRVYFKGRCCGERGQSVVDAAITWPERDPLSEIRTCDAADSQADITAKEDASARPWRLFADKGGTNIDVTLVRRGDGAINWDARRPGSASGFAPYAGFASGDVKSIGRRRGRYIAWVPEGNMLTLVPGAPGPPPGPLCYGKGGTEPTVTDAALSFRVSQSDYFRAAPPDSIGTERSGRWRHRIGFAVARAGSDERRSRFWIWPPRADYAT